MITFPYVNNTPFALCFLKNGSKIAFQYMLVDSGADITVIPKTLGLDLGFTLPQADDTMVKDFSGFGGSVPVILKTIDIRIGDVWLKKVTVGWSLSEEQGFLVLGRKDIFDYFDIEFRQSKGEIVFETAKK